MAIAFVCFLLSGDVDAARKALIDALTSAANLQAIEKNIESLASTDDEATAPALAEAYEKGVDLLKTAAKDVQKWAKEMEDSRVVYDQYGRYVKGKADVFLKAEEAHRNAVNRMMTLDYCVPRVAGAIIDLKSDRQIAGAIKVLKAGDFYTRGCAALALGRSASKDAREALLTTLKTDKDPTLRVALFEALAPHAKEDADVRFQVIDGLKSGEWQVQIAALHAFRAHPAKDAAVHLINAMKGATGRVRNEFNETLKAVTGVDKHGEYEAWKAWWDEHGQEFLDGSYVPHPSERADQKGNSTFYGLPVTSTRLVFLVDTSASMLEKPNWFPPDYKGEQTRLDVAKFELAKVVTALRPGTDFNIVNFHSVLVPYSDKLQRLDDGQRRKALKWVGAIPPGDGTHTWEGLEECFRQAGGNFWTKNLSGGLDTIYLMSDGVPSSGVTDITQFKNKIVAMTRFKKIVIHTIGVDPPANGEVLLKDVAQVTGGMYIRR